MDVNNQKKIPDFIQKQDGRRKRQNKFFENQKLLVLKKVYTRKNEKNFHTKNKEKDKYNVNQKEYNMKKKI